MKKLILMFAMVAICATVTFAKSKKKVDPNAAPDIEFAATSHDFGTIAEKGGPVKCSFEFTNTGDAPLVIITATAACGCTQPVFPREPIAPGKKGVIRVTYLPEGHPGEFNKDVRVKTNVPAKKRISLKIKGVVIPESK